jgi:hypothetical protein
VTRLDDLRVLRVLSAAADANRPCPSNPEMCVLLGMQSPSAGVACLLRLAAAGLILVQRFQTARQVTIVATGRTTFVDPKQAKPHWRDATDHMSRAAPTKRERPPIASRGRVQANDQPLPPAVFRDPCPRCGTRADIGCDHSFSRVSMGAFA